MAPHACTMPLLLLLLLLPLLLLALLGRCLWHSTAHHGVAQRGSVTSQSGIPTPVTAWGTAPPPHVLSFWILMKLRPLQHPSCLHISTLPAILRHFWLQLLLCLLFGHCSSVDFSLPRSLRTIMWDPLG